MSEKKINRDYIVSFLTSGFNPLATTLWKQLVPVQCISCGLTNLFWTKPMYYNQSILTGVSLAWNQNDLTVWTSKWQWNGLGSHQNCYFVCDLLSTLSTQNVLSCLHRQKICVQSYQRRHWNVSSKHRSRYIWVWAPCKPPSCFFRPFSNNFLCFSLTQFNLTGER